MNKEQYKEWYARHAKHLQQIKKTDSYWYVVNVLTNYMTGHEAEYWQDNFDEFIIEVLGQVNDHCNKETGYHSTPHIGCILR